MSTRLEACNTAQRQGPRSLVNTRQNLLVAPTKEEEKRQAAGPRREDDKKYEYVSQSESSKIEPAGEILLRSSRVWSA